MKGLLRESLDRTLLLMRDEVRHDAGDGILLQALMQTEVALCGDGANLCSHAAQSAYITAALLMARSGHRVYLLAPDIPMQAPQPPLKAGGLVSALLEVGRDLIPGIEFLTEPPRYPVDLSVLFGDSTSMIAARRRITLNATDWSSYLTVSASANRWSETQWPFGALGAGALAAGEAFKIPLHRLRRLARHPKAFHELSAFCSDVRVKLAEEGTRTIEKLGKLDIVSAGAITHAALFCVARIPDLIGDARVLEYTHSDHSNLNRYMLLRAAQVGQAKLRTLMQADLVGLRLSGCPVRYDADSIDQVGPLAPTVLVGVDHIPTRWFVQAQHEGWLGVGATSHWSAMSSFHGAHTACVRCLHARDDEADNLIPTVSFVSFWSGLLLAAQVARRASGEPISVREQQIFMSPLRPESVWRAPVAFRDECPSCGRHSGSSAQGWARAG